ncbi:MAG: hypothetical protein JJW01_01335 [Alphaproteobacteria bacterium]|nr:hypothetical protein [Rickettsiales bacterium]
MLIFGFVLIFIFPLLSAMLSCLYSNKKYSKYIDIATIVLSILTWLCATITIYVLTVSKMRIQVSIPYVLHSVKYSFLTNQYGLVFLGLVSTLYPISIIYTLSYFNAQKEPFPKKILAFLHIAIFACFAIAISNNLVTSFIFYELITVTTYPLVIYPMSKQSRLVGKQYLSYLIGSSTIFVVPALIIIHSAVGTLSFSTLGILHSANLSQLSINILFFCILFGIAKTAIFPLGNWLLKAMIAPAPVSAIIHTVIVVKSGLFVILQSITGVFGSELLSIQLYKINNINLFTIVSLITIFIAISKAIMTSNLKERLAYSTISQLGYSLLMFSILTKTSIKAGLVQLVAHSVGKITLFFATGAAYTVYGNYQLKSISSIWRKSPVVSFAVMLSCLSVLGLPPTIGFHAKYNIFSTLLESGEYALVAMVIIASFLSAYYVFDILYNFLFIPKKHRTTHFQVELPIGILIVMGILCCLIVIMPYLTDIILSGTV